MKLALLSLAAVLFLTALNKSDFPPERLAAFEKKQPHDGPGLIFSTPIKGLSIQASWLGDFRPLSPTTKNFLGTYVSMLGQTMERPDFSSYVEETRVGELGASTSFWVPIQKSVAEALRKELKKHETMVLFLRYFGRNDRAPIYLLIDFQKFDDGAVGALTVDKVETLTWAAACAKVGCTAAEGQFLNPGFRTNFEGKFSGKTRPLPNNVKTFFLNYEKDFPGTFKISAARLMAQYPIEAELIENGSARPIWIPLQKSNWDPWEKNKGAAKVHVSIHGTEPGKLVLIGFTIAPANDPSTLLRRRK